MEKTPTLVAGQSGGLERRRRSIAVLSLVCDSIIVAYKNFRVVGGLTRWSFRIERGQP